MLDSMGSIIWRVVLTVALAGVASCGGESTSGDPMIDASGSGSNRDGDIDAPSVSHAPCPTCCDPINQTGCGTGQACYHVATVHTDDKDTYCAPAGSAPLGGYCTIDSDCAAGLTCYPDLDASRMCRKFCVSDADCDGTPGMTRCVLSPRPGHPYGICYQ